MDDDMVLDDDDGDSYPPQRPAGLKFLPKSTLKRLRKKGVSKIEPKYLKLLMEKTALKQTKGGGRRGSFKLSDDGMILMLCWKINEQVHIIAFQLIYSHYSFDTLF